MVSVAAGGALSGVAPARNAVMLRRQINTAPTLVLAPITPF